jgi:hypothetical protein
MILSMESRLSTKRIEITTNPEMLHVAATEERPTIETTPSLLKRKIKNRTADYFFIRTTAWLQHSPRHIVHENGVSEISEMEI